MTRHLSFLAAVLLCGCITALAAQQKRYSGVKTVKQATLLVSRTTVVQQPITFYAVITNPFQVYWSTNLKDWYFLTNVSFPAVQFTVTNDSQYKFFRGTFDGSTTTQIVTNGN